MNREKKKKLKKAACYVGGAAAIIGGGILAYVYGNKPDVVENPCWRSCHLADGRCKKSFDKPWKANLQSVKQLLKHGEICNPYQMGDKFYTGHSKYAWCRSLNPFKKQ